MQPLSPYRLLPIFLDLPTVRRVRGWLDYWTKQTTTFTKIAIGYCLMEFTTYAAYLATDQLPSLSATYIEWPFLFWIYVAVIGLAAIFGRRAHARIARVSRSFAPDTPGGDRLSAFFPALRVFSDPIRYANRHPRYLDALRLSDDRFRTAGPVARPVPGRDGTARWCSCHGD